MKMETQQCIIINYRFILEVASYLIKVCKLISRNATACSKGGNYNQQARAERNLQI